MNAERRKKLTEIIEKLQDLVLEIDIYKGDEETGYYNLPESLQGSENGMKLESNVEYLESAYSDIESAIDCIQRAIE